MKTRRRPGLPRPLQLAVAALALAAAASAPARPPAPPPIDGPGLQSFLTAQAKTIPGRVALHVRVDGGPEAGVRSDEPVPPASVIKLPLMVILEEAWKDGTVKRTDHDLQSMRRMITISDNAAANAIIHRLTMPRVNRWFKQNDYPGSRLARLMGAKPTNPDNSMTAAEATRLMLEIARGEAVSPTASAEMRKVLLAQERRTRLPAGLPPEAVCGNKTGTLIGIVNDVAFVEAPGGLRYAVAVLVSHAPSDEKTSAAIAAFSKRLYETLARVPVRRRR